jgi:hypothetical protein
MWVHWWDTATPAGAAVDNVALAAAVAKPSESAASLDPSVLLQQVAAINGAFKPASMQFNLTNITTVVDQQLYNVSEVADAAKLWKASAERSSTMTAV